MPGHECYHCKQWVAAGEPHDCWTTTEAALTHDLPEDLQEAWHRLRETAAGFGEQRIYASHNSIMFARKACYCFVRPRSTALEVCFFLARTIRAPQISRAAPASAIKTAHIVRVRHRDEVEPPLTDWLREAYTLQDTLAAAAPAARTGAKPAGRRSATAAKATAGARAAAPRTAKAAGKTRATTRTATRPRGARPPRRSGRG